MQIKTIINGVEGLSKKGKRTHGHGHGWQCGDCCGEGGVKELMVMEKIRLNFLKKKKHLNTALYILEYKLF